MQLLQQVLAVGAVILCLHASARALVRTDYKLQDTQWCFVHAIVNVVIASCTWDIVVDLSTHFDMPERKFPILLAMGLHLYHVLFFELSAADRFHHLMFLPTIGLPGACFDWRNIGNVQLFFMCGLPGAILYALVVVQRLFPSVRPCAREPLVSALVNVTLRCPGVLYANAWLFWAWSRSHITVPALFVALQCAIAPANAMFYSYKALLRAVPRSHVASSSDTAKDSVRKAV